MFRWPGRTKGWAITALRPDGSLTASDQNEQGSDQGIKAKLMGELVKRGMSSAEIGKVFLQTMPSFMGLQGINPLSIYWCYKAIDGSERGDLMVVVLEVSKSTPLA